MKFYTYRPMVESNPIEAIGLLRNPIAQIKENHSVKRSSIADKNGIIAYKTGRPKEVIFTEDELTQLFEIGLDSLIRLSYEDPKLRRMFKELRIDEQQLDETLENNLEDMHEIIDDELIYDIDTFQKHIAILMDSTIVSDPEKFLNKLKNNFKWFNFITEAFLRTYNDGLEFLIKAATTKIMNKQADIETSMVIEDEEQFSEEMQNTLIDDLIEMSNGNFWEEHFGRFIYEITTETLIDENKHTFDNIDNVFGRNQRELRFAAINYFFSMVPNPATVIYEPQAGIDFPIFLYPNVRLLFTKDEMNQLKTALNAMYTANNRDERKKEKAPIKEIADVTKLVHHYPELNKRLRRYGLGLHQLDGLIITKKAFEAAKVNTHSDDINDYYDVLIIEILKLFSKTQKIEIIQKEKIRIIEQDNAKELEEKLNELTKKLQPFENLKAKNELLQLRIEELEQELAYQKANQQTTNDQQTEDDTFNEEEFIKQLNSPTTFYIGGNPSLMKRMREVMPNIQTIDTDELNISYESLKQAKTVIFNTSETNHSCFRKTRDNKPKDVPILFINNQFANPSRVLKEVFDQMQKYK